MGINSVSSEGLEFAFPSPGTDGKEAPEPGVTFPGAMGTSQSSSSIQTKPCSLRIGISWDFLEFFCPIFAGSWWGRCCSLEKWRRHRWETEGGEDGKNLGFKGWSAWKRGFLMFQEVGLDGI